ncbi:hypothetical protein RCOM_0977490 [Ricinus communis]|uniref:Uncharacterized protein n=1 Tax=Ricinus communis TaxID=3988 RepID=B9S5K2_RICCO|nr:hypothetical protein RCOM_0977490 [Ricinus communis]
MASNLYWQRRFLSLNPGILCLYEWDPDFNPFEQKSMNTQLWMRLYKLSWFYWHPRILTEIARSIGIPLRIDHATLKDDLGHYARILIDVYLSHELPSTLMIEREGKKLWIETSYKNLPTFRHTCQSIGHESYECHHNRKTPPEADKKSTRLRLPCSKSRGRSQTQGRTANRVPAGIPTEIALTNSRNLDVSIPIQDDNPDVTVEKPLDPSSPKALPTGTKESDQVQDTSKKSWADESENENADWQIAQPKKSPSSSKKYRSIKQVSKPPSRLNL